MKLHDFLPRMFAIAAMNQFGDGRIKRLADTPEPREPVIGSAPEDLRRPLLIGRRGKGTRKQRKGQSDH
jgi:hypothetical protein